MTCIHVISRQKTDRPLKAPLWEWFHPPTVIDSKSVWLAEPLFGLWEGFLQGAVALMPCPRHQRPSYNGLHHFNCGIQVQDSTLPTNPPKQHIYLFLHVHKPTERMNAHVHAYTLKGPDFTFKAYFQCQICHKTSSDLIKNNASIKFSSHWFYMKDCFHFWVRKATMRLYFSQLQLYLI